VNQKLRHGVYLAVVLCFSGFFFVSVSFSQVKKSSPPRWRKGYLDFHQISTGMGNACFIQFPDGSNLLIDAGSINRDYKRQYSPVAVFDSTHSTGSYVAEYIKKCIPNDQPFQLDNVIITHFHDDHVGFPDSGSPWSESRAYRLSGITDLASIIPIKLILDNKWPFYDGTNPVNEKLIQNYQLFIAEQQKRKDF
jgi:mRNA degradation ribonuclease J1/J2